MISFLRGKLAAKKPPELEIEVQGVGYEIQASMQTFYNLPDVGDEVKIHTHLIVREDAHTLFGFASENERTMFRSLIRVNGIGPKVALGILSGISVEGFMHCIVENDVAALTKIPGIGKKTAERLVVEMKDKLDQWGLDANIKLPQSGRASDKEIKAGTPVEDAVSALIALGYKPADASKMIRSVDTAGLKTEEIIRLALQGVSA